MLKQLFHIKNETGGDTAQKLLCLRLGERHCAVCITNKDADQFFELIYYSCDSRESNPLPSILTEHSDLKGNFYKVLIGYDFPQSVLTPHRFYQADDAGKLLRAMYGVNGASTVISEQVSAHRLYNSYAVPRELHDWISLNFASARSWHQYSIQLKQTELENNTGKLYVDFRTNELTVLVISEGNFALSQTFPYSTPEDVLFHLLKVCNQFNLSQEQVHVYLSGLIDQQSVLYKELYQYFIHVEFRLPTWNSPAEDYPLHFFTSLNDLARCE